VCATGVRPEVTVAEVAGLKVGASGALAVDDHQRALGADGVWVAGDCSESHHRLLDRPVNLQLGTHANKQGRIAGINLTGGDRAFPGVLGTAISRICHLEVARTGLNEREAREAGFDFVAETVETDTRARYMPEAERMWVKLVAERGTGRLLGGQITGGATAGKRIDSLALALWAGMDVEELEWVDLSYAPPVSGTLDPVLVAARATAKLA
jgi:NADPH-dependent 2,4-dienoyl-CoA reductase/sulfur reductase-like enzyme